ncbi:flavin monoamine oxidase family protein [Microbacterium gorillae]|uniref:flavin monoamine oxidase family protein n=1 Tax=Microbacterium gorillae TaxID=1231063 RepID=UPI00058C991B|nr:NAD(P)/FAD-dependent oxidoreductase [Microbacterium gorillae]
MRIETRLDGEVTADVIVVGGGIAGLVTVHELARRGITDVVLLEARDRLGGCVEGVTRENGRLLQRGAEFTGAFQHALMRVIDHLGLEVEKLPRVEGDLVRVENGQRHVEAWPFASDDETGAAYGGLYEKLGEMVGQISVAEPWNAPSAAEWDAITFEDWLVRECDIPAAREAVALDLGYDTHEVSLLSIVWWIAKYGSIQGMDEFDSRVVTGMSSVVDGLVAASENVAYLNSPVTAVAQDADGVTVSTASGTVRASSVVLAFDPGMAGRIAFTPELPAQRAALIRQWGGFHDCKAYFVYDRPFWREQGLNGTLRGQSVVEFGMDVSPTDASEGVLCMRRPLTPGRWERVAPEGGPAFDDLVGDADAFFAVAIEQMVEYLGEEGRNVREFHYFEWEGDEWSQTCGLNRLAPGVLTSAGPALFENVGRIIFAGAQHGFEDTLSGAAESGELAAAAAERLLSVTEEV